MKGVQVAPIRVKTRRISNLYVLVVRAPRDFERVLVRRESRKPFAPIAAGDDVRAGSKRLRATRVIERRAHHDGVLEMITEVFTREVSPRVVAMPACDHSVVAQFIRYHVLVRVFDGDPDAWLAHLRERGGDDGDLRFVHWIRSRLRHDPMLLNEIRRMVEATPFWHAAEA